MASVKEMMTLKNPYEVLGVNENASDEEIKRAYRELVKKYHPDQYADNPLSNLADEKIKEINVAYDHIMRTRQSKSSNTYSQSGNYDTNFDEIWNLIQRGDLAAAENRLLDMPMESRTAHWYYLMGEIAKSKGWYDEARVNFTKAINMDPNNMVYRRALNSMYNQTYTYRRTSNRTGYDSSCNMCDFCAYLYCADCCCECMGGDIITCC